MLRKMFITHSLLRGVRGDRNSMQPHKKLVLAIDVLTFINCRSIYWQKRGTRVRGDYGIHVRAVDRRQCAVSYTDFCPFLGHSLSSKKTQSSRKGDWSDKLYRKIYSRFQVCEIHSSCRDTALPCP